MSLAAASPGGVGPLEGGYRPARAHHAHEAKEVVAAAVIDGEVDVADGAFDVALGVVDDLARAEARDEVVMGR